jgi:membrane protease YdiL (CAAX protease family)
MKTKELHKRSPLKYFLLVYGLSLPLWIIERFINFSGLPLNIPITDILAAFTPLISANILIFLEEGKEGNKKLFKRLFDYKNVEKKIWYIFLFAIPLIIFIAIFIVLFGIMAKPFPENWHISLWPVPLIFVFFYLGAIGEEVGYMGYAFDPREIKYGALNAGLIIGFFWAVCIIHQ